MSPVYKLIRQELTLVRELLNKLNQQGACATKETYYPILSGDVHPQAQGILTEVFAKLLTSTLRLVGEVGCAKTPLNMIIAFMMARYHSKLGDDAIRPAVRTATEMFFFRGEVGQKKVPCVFDDGDFSEQRVTTLKAFVDPTQKEAMVWARWGATKFVRGQARFAADNTYDPQPEPTLASGRMLTLAR